jgi:predicted TIM-barrel fold metal-dependent hydrolase
MYTKTFLLTLLLSFFPNSSITAAEIFADSHIHYNWDQQQITSIPQAISILNNHQVKLTIVSSTPSHLALELRKQGGDWIIPFFSPYIHESGKRDWYKDEQVVKQAEQGLKDGLYFGIGEVHFMNGFKPKTDNKIFLELIKLAEKYRVPMLIHIDSGNEITFQRLCSANPEVKMIFAHAGGNLKPEHIEKILKSCNNAWIDFAARDPWRYGGLTNENLTLLTEWKQLVQRYPDRFITGTDPVWKVTRWSTWDTDDEGWSYYDQLYDYHWSWLNDLPQDIRNKIAWENTQKLLK